jgi:hypothetical protein
MNRVLVLLPLLPLLATQGAAQGIRVNPKGVNVNANGATTVFLTFGGVGGRRPAEAVWCGELIPAAPDIGLKCDPATIYGSLPARYDLSTLSGNGGYTDIMSIPPSIARRAYQAAQRGVEPRFFYVRRFVSTTGGPDEYVDVTCRLTGGGARTPFALTDVRLAFKTETEASQSPVLFVKPGEALPPLHAEITYTGTGRLKGRWEVVMPGEVLPSARDLLTEATLPAEDRALQRRYTQLERFNVFLPPTGKHVLPGPDVPRLPTQLEGMYMVLLRVEASDDKEGDSDLASVGAGPDVVHSGAVAGFPLPTLRYLVGSGEGGPIAPAGRGSLTPLLPSDEARLPADKPVEFSWTEPERATLYRLEVQDAPGQSVLAAVLPPHVGIYRAPSWLKDKVADGKLRWRIVALDRERRQVGETPWRTLRLVSPGADTAQ